MNINDRTYNITARFYITHKQSKSAISQLFIFHAYLSWINLQQLLGQEQWRLTVAEQGQFSVA